MLLDRPSVMLLEAFLFPRLAFSGGSLIWDGDSMESSMERCRVHRATPLKVLSGSMIER